MPYFVVAYKGWKKFETLKTHAESSIVNADGILILESNYFFSRYPQVPSGNGDGALMALVDCLRRAVTNISFCQPELEHYYSSNPKNPKF